MKNKLVVIPAITEPIKMSPGFQKKDLSTRKLDLCGLCAFGCVYCSSNNGNYLRIRRERFADLTEAQLGERSYPSADPALMFVWSGIIENLEDQLAGKDPGWGSGETLIVSMLTDPFSPQLLKDGTTERALRLVLERTSFRIRVLTKNAAVAGAKWLSLFRAHPGRVVVGLSTGTLDDELARRMEIGTSSPSARLRATRALQAAGVATYGMLCPILPDSAEGDALDRLVDQVNPSAVEHVWAEPYNDRTNWKSVRDVHDPASASYTLVHGGLRAWQLCSLEPLRHGPIRPLARQGASRRLAVEAPLSPLRNPDHRAGRLCVRGVRGSVASIEARARRPKPEPAHRSPPAVGTYPQRPSGRADCDAKSAPGVARRMPFSHPHFRRLPLPTYVVQIVYRAYLDDQHVHPARVELVVLAARDRDAVVLAATDVARRRELEDVVELPQGDGSLEFVGIRSIREVDLVPPPSPAVVASFNLEPETSAQIQDLVDGRLVHVAFDA